jgi:glycosyltransferase involved in cell wall biosynthesis
MKILLVSTLYNPYEIGGAERSTRLIAKGYKKRGYEVEILTTCDRDMVNYVDEIKVNYVKFKHIFWRFNSVKVSIFEKILWRILEPLNFLNNSKIDNTLKNINPDLIHTNNIAGISPIIWKLAKKNKIKILHTARDYYLLCAKSGMYRNKKACSSQCSMCKIYTSHYKKLSHQVDAFVGVSNFVKEAHLNNGYFSNSKSNDFVNNIFKSKIYKKNRSYNNNNSLKIGVIGFIRETKGVNQLIESLNFNLNINLIIAGQTSKGPYEKSFKKLIKNDKIEYLGYKDPELFFNSIDILIHPAVWHEPFPRVLIESFSYGVPVIASSNGGTNEAIIGLDTGFVYENYQELEKILKEIINGNVNYSNLSSNCLKYSSENFTEEKIINKYLKNINKIC